MKKNQNRLPDFLIAGTMKSGTTTLAACLGLHESVYIPENEIHFFDSQDSFQKGTPWYSKKLLEKCTKAEPFLLGEKTPTYSYLPECAKRIHETIPGVKLIWIFRNPVNRTYSNYLHAVKTGADIRSFSFAVENEKKRIQENIFLGYAQRSRYFLQVERFLKYFDIRQMHFMLFEKFLKNPVNELNKVTDFLGIEPFKTGLPPYHSNPTRLPCFPFSLWLARRISGNTGPAYNLVKYLNYIFPKKAPPMPGDIRKALSGYFSEDNKRLEEITGLEVDIWNG